MSDPRDEATAAMVTAELALSVGALGFPKIEQPTADQINYAAVRVLEASGLIPPSIISVLRREVRAAMTPAEFEPFK